MKEEFTSAVYGCQVAANAASIRNRVDWLTGGLRFDVTQLNTLALKSLASLYEERERLFCRRIVFTQNGFWREGTSRKHTIIALLGLQHLAEAVHEQVFDIALIREVALRDKSWVKSIGELGLLTWFTAESEPDKLRALFDEFDFKNALENYSDSRHGYTSGLALFLAGIAHARISATGCLPDLTDIAIDTYRLLQDNQSDGGIFGHAAHFAPVPQRFCKRFGTLADQTYSIYAMTTFARAFQLEEPLASALACANSIRALQGELGQWWFLYDARACRALNRYPVLSLHQDGTAPLALFALQEATGQRFQEEICKGLNWISGANELGKALGNRDRGIIWHSIGLRRRLSGYLEAVLNLIHECPRPRSEALRVRYEATPEHFGLLLRAFGRFGLADGLDERSVRAEYQV